MPGWREGLWPGLGVGTSGAITASVSFIPPGFKRWLSSSSSSSYGPAPRVCVVGSGPAGFYTAQHILKVPGWALAMDEGRETPAEGGISMLPGSKRVGEWVWGLLGVALASQSLGPLRLGWALLPPSLPCPWAIQARPRFSTSDFAGINLAAETCLAPSCCHPTRMT